jgi:tetratricopeptide (TPR) repeat protein
MQLSNESYRARWLILVSAWTLAAVLLFLEARLMRDYVDILDQLGLRGAPAASTPLKEGYPAFAADAQTWVRHAIALTEGDQVQLRWTTIDNAPFGREVHWNSGWAWAIAGAGWINHLFTGAPMTSAIERATVWLTPAVLLVLIMILSSWATRQAGVIAGVVIVAAMSCNDRIYEGFFPCYVDHHGLMTVAVFGMMLGAVFMGGGWWQAGERGTALLLPSSTESARRGAIFSAISGGLGMWVSAASILPPIVLVGAAGGIAILIQGRTARSHGEQFAPEIWRLWGRVGAATSFLFYLVEYFPGHLGMRLEANHPLYAIGWLGGAELVALLGERWFAAPEDRWKDWPRLAWPLAAVLIAPAAIILGGTKVFIVADPFLASLHKNYIQEFLPIWKTIQGFDAKMAYQVLFVENVPLIAAILTLTYKGRETPLVVWFVTIATLLFNVMAWWQSRWLLNASGVQVCLAVVLIGTWTGNTSQRARWVLALAMAGLLFVPSGVMRYLGASQDVAARRVSPRDAANMLFRDVAAVLRASQPTGDIVLLSSPNASTSVGYYGRFKTLGTLYWENNDGLHHAAEILSAKTEAQAAELIKKYGVTHIAMISDENFIVQYYQLLHPDATSEEIKDCFGYRILADKKIPQWLEMIPYGVPEDLKTLKFSVMLFKVNFSQNLMQALYNVGLSQIAMGSVEEGERTFDLLTKQAPQIYQPWLRKGELLLARHNWAESAEITLKGISLAPVNERPGLYVTTGGSFYNNKQHALAVRVYRAGLTEQYAPDLACYLAWVLSTSTNDSIRNGQEALQLAQEAIKADPNSPSYLNSLSASLAENGRFPEAVDAADRALANSRLKGDSPNIQAIFERRLATIKSGKPIRE